MQDTSRERRIERLTAALAADTELLKRHLSNGESDRAHALVDLLISGHRELDTLRSE